MNLAVKDLDRSMAFFEQLGFTFNPQFTDKTAACMVITDDIYAMLLAHPKFREFTTKDIADAHKTTEVLTCLSFDSKEFTTKDIADAHKTTEVLTCLSFDSKDKVNEIVDRAITAGVTEARGPQDYGFMYGRSFNDLDGHIWEIIWMGPSHIQQS